MGIYDRDYYRREGPSFLGVIADTGTACKWIIGLNVLCFLIQMGTMRRWQEVKQAPDQYGEPGQVYVEHHSEPGFFEDAFILDVNKTLHGQVWRLLTYAFLHSTNDVWHIVWNMLILWWFGKDVEDLYGTREFTAFYLVSAVVSGLAYCAATVAGVYHGAALGASGAVTAALVLCAVHYPTRLIYVFFFLPVPIWLFVVATVAKDAFDVLNHTQNGVGAAAHVGGAAFAFAYYQLHWRISNLLPALKTWQKRRSQPRLRVYRGEERAAPAPVGVTAAPPPPPPQPGGEDEQLEAKVDAVLEKLSRVGIENLSESEREVLRRGSERFKRRRT